MVFKVGQPNQMAIANIADQSKEVELKKFDHNNDGVLNIQEASNYYTSKTNQLAGNNVIDDVFNMVGGRQHDVQTNPRDHYQTMYTYAPNHKGNFNIPGIGAGNVRTGRSGDNLQVLIDCDLIDMDFINNNVDNVTLMLGPKGFSPEGGSDLGEAVAIPMDIASQPSRTSWNRGGGSSFIPEKKFLATSMNTGDLKQINNGDDLSFFIKIQSKDGNTHYINKDGQAFNNFNISGHEIR